MLFDAQKETLRRMVQMSEMAGTQMFIIHHPTYTTPTRIAFPARPDVQCVVDIDDGFLGVLESQGYVRVDDDFSGTLLPKAFEAVRTDFASPLSASSAAIGNTMNVYGNVSGTIAQGHMVNVTVTGSDAERFIAAVREAAKGHADVNDHMDFVIEELNTGTAKPRKLQAYIGTAMTFDRNNAALATALVNLAKFLGLGNDR